MAETALNFDKHNQYTKSYVLPEGFKEEEIVKMKNEEKVTEKPEDLRDWIKKSVSGRKSVTGSGTSTPTTAPNNGAVSAPRSPRARADSDDNFGGIETSLDDIFESISGKGGIVIPQKAGVNASSSSKTTRIKKPTIEYNSDSDDDTGTPRGRSQPTVSTTFASPASGNSPKSPSPRASVTESSAGTTTSNKRGGLRRTNSYLQQREEVLLQNTLETESGAVDIGEGEGGAGGGLSSPAVGANGKSLKRTQSYLERREAELKRLSESRRGSLSTDSNDLMNDFPMVQVSASNAPSKNVSRVGSGDQAEWDAALKNNKGVDSSGSSAIDAESLSLKLSKINTSGSSEDSGSSSNGPAGQSGFDSPGRASSTDSGDAGDFSPDRRRHSIPARPTSLKNEKSFKPMLQTIYSMRSEMDMNESMYLSTGNSMSNKSNAGSFYNSGSSSSRENTGSASGLVPDSVNANTNVNMPAVTSPTAVHISNSSFPSPGRGSMAKPIVRKNSFAGPSSSSSSSSSSSASASATPASDLYKKAIRRSIGGGGGGDGEGEGSTPRSGGDNILPKKSVVEEEPKIVYNAAKILRKTIMTHKNKEGEMVEATANDAEDESAEPLVEFVLEYHTLEYIQEKARMKDYEGLLKCQLEKHLSDEDFEKVFKMTFEKFYSMPAWRQADQKKKHKIF